ncbi:MAG TPA: ABC-F family ATP-binding cassette domain-containing protein [Longimicrobiales bacterium]|nr:ABC-F family ATP-binding cassette domain-containing protein [Longimicrobiales bacterium]
MQTTTGPRDARISTDRLSYALPDGRTLFNELTISFGRERTGLVGPNGSGKTTLVRLLSGDARPTAGSVHRSGLVALLPQDFRPPPGASLAAVLGVEKTLAALERSERGTATLADIELIGDDWDLRERTAAVLARFGLTGLTLDRPLAAVSGGETTRVALAGLVLQQPDFLLLDEPTNHLDAASRAALYAFIESWDRGALCVSHDRELLRRMDRIVELSAFGARVYGGNYDEYRAIRDAEDAAAERELDSARAALRAAERDAREVRERQARREAQGRRNAATANLPKILLNGRKARAQETGARVRAITAREVEERRERAAAARQRVEERERPRFALPSTNLPAGRVVLEITEACVTFAGATDAILENVSLRVVGPERVAVVGPNGSGKTTLLRVALGELTPDSGDVRRLPDDEIGFLDQAGARLDPALSVLDNFRGCQPELDPTATRYALARFLFSHEAALQPVGTLSGGERLRASLACVLGGRTPPSLLVLDEPTNHLDLDALAALEDALQAYDGALLVVSHDRPFLDAIGVQRRVRLG